MNLGDPRRELAPLLEIQRRDFGCGFDLVPLFDPVEPFKLSKSACCNASIALGASLSIKSGRCFPTTGARKSYAWPPALLIHPR